MKALVAIVMVAMLAGGRAYATCTYPKPPDKIPDGNTATYNEMVAGMQMLNAYNADVKAYTDCLRQEYETTLKNADPTKLTKEQKDELQNVAEKKSNAAIDAATEVTNRFNEQVKAFKAKAADKKS